MRRLAERGVDLVLEDVVQVPERFLLGDDLHVVAPGVGDELADIGAGHGPAGRGDQRIGGVAEGVLEVRRVDVELVGREGADLLLLEFQRGHRPAGEVVFHFGEFTIGEAKRHMAKAGLAMRLDGVEAP